MSDNLEPISPSEAARILSQSRWSGSDNEREPAPPEPASDEGPTYYGREGVERSAGYEPMRPAIPVKQPDAGAIESAVVSEALRQEAQVAEPIPINYLEQGGERAGQPMPDNQTVSPEQAAHDLSRMRESFAQAQADQLDTEIARAIDELRSGDAQPQPDQQAPELHPNDVTAAPEVQQTPEPAAVVDDEVQKALSSPKVLAAVQQHIAQAEAQSNAIGNYYAQAVQHNAMAATAALLSQFSELQNLTPEQVPVAIQTVARSNPERAQSMVRHIETTRALVAEQQRVQAAQHQQIAAEYGRNLQRAARDADAAFAEFEKAQNLPADQVMAIRNEARAMWHDYGVTDEQLERAWLTDATFRSAPAQRLMWDAARWRLAQKGAAAKVARPQIPVVQHPGSPLARGSDEDYSMRKMNERIDRSTGREQIRAAAELVAARRSARR